MKTRVGVVFLSLFLFLSLKLFLSLVFFFFGFLNNIMEAEGKPDGAVCVAEDRGRQFPKCEVKECRKVSLRFGPTRRGSAWTETVNHKRQSETLKHGLQGGPGLISKVVPGFVGSSFCGGVIRWFQVQRKVHVVDHWKFFFSRLGGMKSRMDGES